MRDVKGYKCFQVFRDRNGDAFKDGPRWAIFVDNALVKEYSSSYVAERNWRIDPLDGCRLSDYKGIDDRLK
jgi:hypothetical protein